MSNIEQYTLIPLRDVVVFPFMIVPIFVGRPRSVKALQIAESTDKKLFLALQQEASTDEPTIDDLNPIGVVADILQVLKLPDGTVKVLVEGGPRGRIKDFRLDDECYFADVEILEDESSDYNKAEAVRSILAKAFESYAGLTKRIAPDLLKSILNTEDTARFSYTVAANIPLKAPVLQSVLEIDDTAERIEKLIELIEVEMEIIRK